MRELPGPDDDNDRAVLGHVRAHGWAVIGLPEDDDGPGYSFSVGLFHTLGCPELLVVGQKPETARGLINHAGGLVRGGRRFAPGERADDVLVGYPAVFVPVDPRHYREYLGYARWLYRGSDFPSLQLVWPDRAGRFPWEWQAGAGGLLLERQRVLGPAPGWPHGWPFPDVPNTAAFTTRQVLRDGHPILHVSRDADDGAWQFHGPGGSDPVDGMIVSLEVMLNHDPSLAELGNLPPGRRAWRESPGGSWNRTTDDG